MAGATRGVIVPHCSSLTLGHLVQQHRDLLILQQPALEEGDEDAVGELTLAQLIGFSICTPVTTGQWLNLSWGLGIGPNRRTALRKPELSAQHSSCSHHIIWPLC